MVGNLANLTFGVASLGRGLNEVKSTSSRTNGGKGRLSKMLSLNARDRSLKGHASVDQSKLEKFLRNEPNYLELFSRHFGRRTTGLKARSGRPSKPAEVHHSLHVAGAELPQQHLYFGQAAAYVLRWYLPDFPGDLILAAAAFLYELAWIYCGHGGCGDHPFGSHGRGDDQVSKWLRLCDDAFLQAGHPGDDYPIRMQVSWRL